MIPTPPRHVSAGALIDTPSGSVRSHLGLAVKWLIMLLIMLRLTPTASAENRWLKWTRRAVGIAACAASAVDGYDTSRWAGRNGVQESNPILRSPGGIRTGRMIAIKAPVCAVPLVIGEVWHKRVPQSGALAFSGSSLVVFTAVDVRNRKLLH